jgi:hypothetical protein
MKSPAGEAGALKEADAHWVGETCCAPACLSDRALNHGADAVHFCTPDALWGKQADPRKSYAGNPLIQEAPHALNPRNCISLVCSSFSARPCSPAVTRRLAPARTSQRQVTQLPRQRMRTSQPRRPRSSCDEIEGRPPQRRTQCSRNDPGHGAPAGEAARLLEREPLERPRS